MDPTMLKLRNHINSVQAYLTPLLPLANCHMVEFITHNHWETILPRSLRETLDEMQIEQAVELFWSSCESKVCEKSAVSEWVHKARALCLDVNDEYCLSAGQLATRAEAWGGALPPEITGNEFMSPKKSYEVRKTVGLVSALAGAARAALALEAGGGRGALGAAASAFGLPSLTVDCDPQALAAAARRSTLMQKQWHAAAARAGACAAPHRVARRFVTGHTDLAALAREHFPELPPGDLRVLLTGLHTCGNLGPSSLRMFSRQTTVAGLLSVPCCYHLLSERTDAALFDSFQRDFGGEGGEEGFPMSEHLRGYTLGRNARMLAAQSAERAAARRRLPARSLLYRALLQDIIKKHKPDFVLPEGKLKRVSAKTQDFEQYFKMADSILNLELADSLPASYFTNVDCHWKNMVMFYLIRMCLAQVVETLILLDRLLFLRENGFKNAFLVKLFDPVLSPRCHGIVAIRR